MIATKRFTTVLDELLVQVRGGRESPQAALSERATPRPLPPRARSSTTARSRRRRRPRTGTPTLTRVSTTRSWRTTRCPTTATRSSGGAGTRSARRSTCPSCRRPVSRVGAGPLARMRGGAATPSLPCFLPPRCSARGATPRVQVRLQGHERPNRRQAHGPADDRRRLRRRGACACLRCLPRPFRAARPPPRRSGLRRTSRRSTGRGPRAPSALTSSSPRRACPLQTRTRTSPRPTACRPRRGELA